MKKYFEYPFNAEVEGKLTRYYENTNLNQHNENHFLKGRLKLKRIEKLSSFKDSDVVLDVGCSNGYLLKTISRNIKSGKGIDISQTIIESDKKTNDVKNISFEVFDGDYINMSEKYNKILLVDVLEHAFHPDLLIDSIKNTMTSGGVLIIEVPFTGWLSELVYGAYHQGHLRYYDPDYLSNYVKKSGLSVEQVVTYNSVPMASLFIKFPPLFSVLDFLVNLIPSNLYPYFGEVLVLARKNT